MASKKNEMRARVDARRRAEAEAKVPPKPKSSDEKKSEISNTDLLGYPGEP